MDEDSEREKKRPEMGLTWWVRYAFVPIMVALIAGISAVRAADLLKPAAADPPPVMATSTATEAPGEAGTVVPHPPQVTDVPPPSDTPTFTASPTPSATPTATETPFAPISAIGQHIVRPGEHLYCIGRAYGVLPQAIAQANQLGNASLLAPGQALAIPAVPWSSIPDGPVCEQQFDSPFPGGVEIASNPAPEAPADEAADEPPPETAAPSDTPLPTLTHTATQPAGGGEPYYPIDTPTG